MHRRQQLELVLRRIGKAAPRAVRGPLGRASRRFRSWPGPLVTIVLAVSDEETTRIGPALDSLRAQTHRNLDILVVPYGRSTRVRAVAAEHADQDWRVRVLGRVSENLAEARNGGAAAANGSYLVFAAGGDDVPVRGIQRLVASLESSGSSLAVGRIQPPRTVLPSTEAPYLAAHEHDVSGTTLAASPWAVTDLAVGNRMFRRTFWRDAGLGFSPEVPSGSDLALASLAHATSFDLLRNPTYTPTGRLDGVSVGAVRDVLARLEPWLEEHQRTWRAVEALELPEVKNWLLWGVLDTAIHPFLDDVERATEHHWKTLRGHAELLLDSTDEHAWTTLRAESRVKLWLLLNDRRDALEEYVAARLFEGSSRPTEVVDGKVVAHLPFLGDAEVGVPAECYEMDATETPLRVVLHGVRWSDPETLELDLHARIDHVGFADEPRVAAALVRSGTGERVEVPLRQYVDPQANQTGGRRYQDYSRGALTLVVDARDLARRAATIAEDRGEPAAWSLELTVTTSGLTRSGPVTSIDDRGSAGMIDTGHLAPRLVDGVRVGVTGRDGAMFRLVARRQDGARLEDVQVSGRRVTGTIRPGDAGPVSVRVSMSGSEAASAPLHRSGDLLRFSLEVPRPWAGSGTATWRFGALAADGTDVPVAWPDQPEQWLAVGAGDLVVSRSASGGTDLVETKDTLVLEDVELRDGRVRVSGRGWCGPERGTRSGSTGDGPVRSGPWSRDRAMERSGRTSPRPGTSGGWASPPSPSGGTGSG